MVKIFFMLLLTGEITNKEITLCNVKWHQNNAYLIMLIATASTLASPRKILTFSYGAEILAFLPKSKKI